MEATEKLRPLKDRWTIKTTWGKDNKNLKASLTLQRGGIEGFAFSARIPWIVGLQIEKRQRQSDAAVEEDSRLKEYSLEITRHHLIAVWGGRQNSNAWFNGSIYLFRWQRLKWNNDVYQKYLRQANFDNVVFFPHGELETFTSHVRLTYHRRYRLDRTKKLIPLRREKWVTATMTPAVPTETGSVSQVVIPTTRRFVKSQSDLQTLTHIVKHIGRLRGA